MTDPRSQVPAYRKEIRQTTLKHVARLLSDYYQSIQQQVNQEDLKKETFDIVKNMDHMAAQEARDENDYKAIMNNRYNLYQQHLFAKRKEMSSDTDPRMMATVMINFLPKLQEFMEKTEFQPHDLKLIQQLIQFIKSIPSNNYGVTINKSEQKEAVKLYYEKLFIPIQKTIENQPANQMMQSQSASQNQLGANPQQQQQMMQQMIQAQGMQAVSLQHPMPTMQQMMQQQQMQRSQITPSMSQQMPSPNQQDLNAIPRQMPVPTPQGGIGNALPSQQPQDQQHPDLSMQTQPPPQQMQQMQTMQNMQQIQQQPSVQQIQQIPPNPRSPQQKPRSPQQSRSMAAASPQMMPQKQQQIHQMGMPVNSMQPPQQMPPQPPQSQQVPGRPMPNAANNADIIKNLFSNVRSDCAVFYSTPHPPHF